MEKHDARSNLQSVKPLSFGYFHTICYDFIVRLHNKTLLFFLSLFGLSILSLVNTLPHYIFYALLFLVIPSIYFIFRAEKTLDEKRFLLVILVSLLGGFLWDSIAIYLKIWSFPKENILIWFYGVPLEEFIFFATFPTIAMGIYSSLPSHRKQKLFREEPKVADGIILIFVFALQIGLFTSLLFFGMNSYLKWLLFFAGFPSVFYLFRKGERIDEINLLITVVIWVVYLVIIDPFFIVSRAWFYSDAALLGRIWIIPIDDILFTIFCTILTIGIYTSIPKKILQLGGK